MTSADDTEARRRRADAVHEQIDRIKGSVSTDAGEASSEPPAPPQSPRAFIEQRMRELAETAKPQKS